MVDDEVQHLTLVGSGTVARLLAQCRHVLLIGFLALSKCAIDLFRASTLKAPGLLPLVDFVDRFGQSTLSWRRWWCCCWF
ncbi:MAG TPA: hypothetical protein VFI31_28930 [Pirellulales bacterium]|nr:hypothetical protein [Pirellulales bacterium]